jgi:hypothetical protein
MDFNEISDSHSGEYEDDCLLGGCTVVVWYILNDLRGADCLHHEGGALIALMMEVVSISETVNFYQTAQHNIPADRHLQNILSSHFEAS